MTTYRTRGLAIALTLAAATTALTATAAPAAQARSTGAGAPASDALDWKPCAFDGAVSGQECASLPVPLDYAHPRGPGLTVAVSRLRSQHPDKRRGALLVIPGGPGGSGVRQLAEQGPALRTETGGAYDVVSLDPRGVGASTTASCGLSADDRMLVNLRSWPGPGGDISENVARSRRVAEACERNGGAVLRSFTTRNEVRDIDRFRQALGERRLSAYGVSYGTYVGAVYAQSYPQHTDRWVLDSNGDPDPRRVERGWLANMAPAADIRFPDFAAWASDPAREAQGLRLAQRPSDVRPLFLALAAKLDVQPRETTTNGVALTGNHLRQALQLALYSDSSFPMLARLVQQAQDPAVTPVLPPPLAEPLSDQDAAATVGVICNDVSWPRRTPGTYERAVAADRLRHPLTAGSPVNIVPCAFFKEGPAEKPVRVTDDGPSNILMIQGLRDPATPYFGALKMRRAWGDRARLVTVDHGGHGMYLDNGNACGDRAVTTFLTTGERPEKDTYCAG
ncbi:MULTISPECIES: alpha/beta hydrolase [unclassified Streptomyces]|uniref:alpha/beta hydrolase n=1 Tax=unclassified Streptomyces TaxID=2593676 RepID=UPI0033D662B8